uniref:Bifunctional inhibitor/plant lipid transfer protein/seed storage helical domain-containing protein n=1 Tax=Tanacetum cinerariifolium TaxID=118510 RepID=A0A6L2P5J8_TANCI|nr:hypothetical protein [Tanacetum cinerariifolium]
MNMKFICVIVVAFMVVTVPYTEAFRNCGQVVSYLVPCTKYLKSGGVVTASCCDSLKGLKSVAKTSAEASVALMFLTLTQTQTVTSCNELFFSRLN